jgi:glycine/D-amino acid oxidase-like deaminating enzyme
MARTPHFAVVGAGAFGGWTALALLRGGARVTLLDAWGPGNSRSSSGGETRIIRGIYGPDRTYIDWLMRSCALWRENAERWGETLYHRTGVLWMFCGADVYARASLPWLAEAGLPVDELSPAEARRRYPQIDFSGVGSVFLEHEAGYLLARRACRAVAAAFVASGGEMRERAARPGAIDGDAMAGLELSDGSTLRADGYAFACGPWLGELFPEVIGERIRSTRQEVYFFGTPAGDPRFQEGGLPVWIESGSNFFYGIPGNEHRGFKVADDGRGVPFDPTAGDRAVTPALLERARRHLALRFPAMVGAPLVEARVCQYENSVDGHFLIDHHPRAGNVWLVGGGSGHGFKLGPAVGEHAAALMTGQAAGRPEFALGRPGLDPRSPLVSQFAAGGAG